MVEHVVTATEDNARFQDRPFEFGRPDDFLRGPLRLVVGGAAIRSRPQEAEERYASYAGLFRGTNRVPRTLDVHRAVRLATQLPVDPGAMGHRVAPSKRPPQRLFIAEPCRDQGHTSRARDPFGPWTSIDAAGDGDN